MSDSGDSITGPPSEAQQQQQQPELGPEGAGEAQPPQDDIPGPLRGVLRDPEERETIDASTVRRRMTEMSPEERAEMERFDNNNNNNLHKKLHNYIIRRNIEGTPCGRF